MTASTCLARQQAQWALLLVPILRIVRHRSLALTVAQPLQSRSQLDFDQHAVYPVHLTCAALAAARSREGQPAKLL